MTEVFEHNPGDHEDPLTGPTWIVGFFGAVLLIVIGLGLTALYYNAQNKEEVIKVVQRDPQELEQLRQQQIKQLTDPPRYVQELVKPEGQETEQVGQALVIPIDRAMELVMNEYVQKR